MSLMIFEWREDEEYGDYGWIAKGYSNFNSTRPEMFSHDCLEHFPRGLKHGPYADELLALGARLFIRVESGWIFERRLFYTVPQLWAHELEEIYRSMCGTGNVGRLPDPGFVPELDNDMDAEVAAAVVEFWRQVEKGREHERLPIPNAKLCGRMASWLRLGYRACQERFKGASCHDIEWLAKQRDEEAKKYRHADEGDLLYVRVHEKNMEFSFRHVASPYRW